MYRLLSSLSQSALCSEDNQTFPINALRSTGGRSLVEQPPGWKTPIAFISWDDRCRQAHNVGASRHQVGPKSNRHALRAGRRWWILRMPGSSRTHLLLDGFPAWPEHIHVLFLHITDLHYTVTLNFKTRHNCVHARCLPMQLMASLPFFQ